VKKFILAVIAAMFAQLGIVCEAAIQEAFATRGFGLWAPLSRMTISRKGHDMILRQTGQLARSISSRVENA